MSGDVKEFTKADAAKAVKRTVPVLDDDKKPKRSKEGEIITKPVAVTEEEVFDFKKTDGGVVTVVTTDGQKLVGEVK
jgi:3,4-dihydroxy-2-butanone 4-phosphate synthase